MRSLQSLGLSVIDWQMALSNALRQLLSILYDSLQPSLKRS